MDTHRQSMKFASLEAQLTEAIIKVDRARDRYEANEIPGDGKGLFDDVENAKTAIGEAILELLDNGHYIHIVDLFTVSRPVTLKGDQVRQHYSEWEPGQEEEQY